MSNFDHLPDDASVLLRGAGAPGGEVPAGELPPRAAEHGVLGGVRVDEGTARVGEAHPLAHAVEHVRLELERVRLPPPGISRKAETAS